jgi:hypothetical protein
MAAFLLLPIGADLTLADVEAWVARARALGASDSAPVKVGPPPLAESDSSGEALSVPVTVSRTILPGAAPATPDPAADAESPDEADRKPRTRTKASQKPGAARGDGPAVDAEADSEAGTGSQAVTFSQAGTGSQGGTGSDAGRTGPEGDLEGGTDADVCGDEQSRPDSTPARDAARSGPALAS